MSLAAGPGRGGPVDGQLPDELRLVVDKHVAYIQSLDTRRDELEYHLTEHLRMSGIYWGLTALHLLGHPEALPRAGVLDFVLSCLHGNGGFGAAPGHDAHMLYTVSAVQILALLDAFTELEERVPEGKVKIARYIASLQQPDGTFAGDEWGETDTRFLYGALNALSLLHLLPHQQASDQLPLINVSSATAHIKACHNFDGGFGVTPGAESHAGKDRLGAWLSERQLEDSGGFNGRPMKLVDVCYSWWVGSSLAMIGRLHWVDRRKLIAFILSCQDANEGGIADRPGDMVDVFHTHFAIAGLSLLGLEGVEAVNAAYCLPTRIVDRILER